MAQLNLHLDGDNCWPDLKGQVGGPKVIHLGNDAPPIGVAVLPHGMIPSGLPSVTFRIDLPDGRTVLAETSARLFVTAARAILARHPELER